MYKAQYYSWVLLLPKLNKTRKLRRPILKSGVVLNTQLIEKRIKNNSDELEVVSMFRTIQGEGPYTGHRSFFIRLAGCNLQCPGCDTDYTSNRKFLPIDHIIRAVRAAGPAPLLVVITGGEPFRQDITVLSSVLIALGYPVQVETNGAFAPSEGLDRNVMIVCSPKTGSINKEMFLRADCFKYVMHADSVDPKDGLPILALDHSASPKVARPRQGWPVYLQPMDSKNIAQNERNLAAVVHSCMEYGYILQLQLHKIIGME